MHNTGKKPLFILISPKPPTIFCPKIYLIFSWGCGLWQKKTIRINFNNQGVVSSRFVCLGGGSVLILIEH